MFVFGEKATPKSLKLDQKSKNLPSTFLVD